MALVPARPRFDRRADGAPTYARGRRRPAWMLLAIPFVALMAMLLPVVRRRVHWMACLLTVGLFELVMLPVEHWSILRGHWVYNEHRILGPLFWGIPIEEPLIYYLLPPILVIMIFEYLAARLNGSIPAPDGRRVVARWWSTAGRPGASYWSRRRAGRRAAGRIPMSTTAGRSRSRSAPKATALLCALAAGLCTPSARAADPLPPPAILSEAIGDVTVVRGLAKTVIDGEEDLALREGDEVKTAAGAKATISFRDAHLVRLSERSSLVIRTLKSTSTGFFGQVKLVTGKLFASLASLTGTGSGFKVETRTAIAAVKGTTFAVEDAEETSVISVLEGTVSAAGIDEQGRETEAVDVPAGQETDVPVRGRRPGKLRGFLKDAKRAAIRGDLDELRGHAGRHRDLARSGELGRGRKLRNLARANYLLELESTDPDALNALPEERRAEVRQFLDEHRDELRQRGPEVRRFLDEHPEMKDRMRAQAERRVRRRELRDPHRPHQPPQRPQPAKPPRKADRR